MPYSLSLSVAASSKQGSTEQILKHEPGVQGVNLSSLPVARLTANTAKLIDPGGITNLNLLMIKADTPVDISLIQDNTPADVWLGVRMTSITLSWPAGQAVSHIKIRSAAAGQAEIFLAGS